LAFAGCAGAHPPRRPALGVKLVELPKLAYLAPLSYSPHYGIFRDLEGRPWGAGRVLAAYWRKDFGYESELKGLAFSSRGPLVVEATQRHFDGVLHRLDSSGVTVSSATLAVEDIRAIRGGTGRLAVLEAGEVSILDPQGGSAVAVASRADRLLTADIDGDGQDELIVHSWKEGSLSAYRSNGRKLWSRGGFGRVYAMVAGRLGASRTGVLISGGAEDFKANALTGITGAGKVFLSTPLAWSEFDFACLADLGDGPRLVSVGYSYPNNRQILKVSRLGEKGLDPLWQFDLNWTSVSAVAAADLNGDGRQEILLGTKNGWILVFSAEGRPLAEKNVLGEITHMETGDLAGNGRQEVLVAVKGIPPELYAVGVIPDPGPWPPAAKGGKP